MSIRGVDANVILRFLVGEPADQFARARRLFSAVENGREKIYLEDAIFAEIVCVAMTQYGHNRDRVTRSLWQLLEAEAVRAADKEALRASLVLFEQLNVDLVDALLAAKALRRGEPEIWSFDRDFERIPGIRRLEP